MADELTFNLDGKVVDARPGELLIAAAQRHGTYIPRFCWHPRMKPVGMCRMCLVEIEGPKGKALQPACMLPVSDGMVVSTTSAPVKKAQDGVLEFLLINHPLDCPVCDRGGECPLQDQTFAYGPGESRFVEEKRHFEKPIAISPLVALDRERCIQCARCTRFADEVAGDPLINFVERGNQTQVLTFPDQPFASYFSGNTVQICPVGALTATPYRFRARPWDLEQVESTCTSCSVGCRVLMQSSSDRIIRYLGIDSEPVNHGWLCDKGRFDFEALASDERLREPLVRRQVGNLEEAPWDEALQAAAAAIKAALLHWGPEAVAVLGGARLPNEDAYAWSKLARAVFGTDNVDAQLGDGLPAEVVLGLPRATIDQACSASALVVLGPDLREELPVLYLRLREAVVDRGVPLVELTPCATGFSRHAAAGLVYRPGEVAALARALVRAIGGRPSGEVAGISGDDIARAASLLGDNPVVIVGRPSLAESADQVAEAAGVLAAALPGARFLPALRRANVLGALDAGLAPGVLPGRVSLDDGRAWFEAAWGKLPESRGLDATGVLTAAAAGDIRALVLVGADPLADFPDRDLARRALAGAGYVVAIDLFLTESCRAADVVLPVAGYGERPGTTTNLEGRVSRLAQKVTPPGTTRHDWMIAADLAFRLGGDLGFESLADIGAEICRLAPSHAGLTPELLATPAYRDGIVIPLDGLPHPPPAGAAPDEAVAVGTASNVEGDTPSIQPATGAIPPTRLPASLGSGDDAPAPRPGLSRPALLGPPSGVPRSPRGSKRADEPGSLNLVVGRSLYDLGTLVTHSPSLATLAPAAELRVHPDELERLGVAAGGQVRVSSARGSIVLATRADAGVPPGSAAVAFNQPGVAVGDLIDVTAPVTSVRVEAL